MSIRRAEVLLAVRALDRACLASFAGPARVTLFPPFLDPAPFAAAAARRDAWRTTLAAQYRLAAHRPWPLAGGMMRSGDKLAPFRDRKSVGSGKGVYVRVDVGGSRSYKKKKSNKDKQR